MQICRVRPLVYRNPLLYELAGGCDVDLPRVTSVSWQKWIVAGWSAAVEWTEFESAIRSGLEVRFSRPIRTSTLHAASVHLTAITSQRGADYWAVRRVPTERPRGKPEHHGIEPLDVHDDLAWGVRLKPAPDWIQAEVTGDESSLFRGARFELTIRGQLLRDRCGQMLDARPVDIRGRAHGHARPGDDFVSAFQVGPRRDSEYGSDYSATGGK